MLRQVEFLIEGYLLPPTMKALRVSSELLIEPAFHKGSSTQYSYEHKNCALAYVAVEAPETTHYFRIAQNYLDFFLLIYSLISRQPVIHRMSIGTTLESIDDLGKQRFGFPYHEKIEVLNSTEDDFLCKPILESKALFLSLLPQRHNIIEKPIGIALTYFYYALRAREIRLGEALINLIIAAESLLIIENEKKGQNLARRLSLLIGQSQDEKDEIAAKIRKLYGLRCGIVHGGGNKPTLKDVDTLFNYLGRAIKLCLSSMELDKQKLVRKLDVARR